MRFKTKTSGAAVIELKDTTTFKERIVLPSALDARLEVGWRHRHYGSARDPKHDIAEKIMGMLFACGEIAQWLKEERGENAMADLGMQESDFTQHQLSHSQDPFRCSVFGTGEKRNWSSDGLYFGEYDDEQNNSE